ncbi:hypothetical protein AVEN_73992-1 [Araneus ventricosus]|uniref:Uncharacterized protein n=1 Tax=Araneus ventricosus TaxID=182803 RepID=A0A4Y2IC19_ARAVE|nr:hypothetical protein AVEN_73992-1 [Araneus ventricosus]
MKQELQLFESTENRSSNIIELGEALKTIPLTSAEAERVFSAAGSTPRRKYDGGGLNSIRFSISSQVHESNEEEETRYLFLVKGTLEQIGIAEVEASVFDPQYYGWDSRDRKKHYIKKWWPKRQFLKPGVKNEENEPLVAPEKILLPPLHIKLSLMKNFVKAMDCGGSGFQYLRLKFPKVSEAKIKEGIFVGPQFRQLMKDPVFESKLTKKEAAE